MFRVKLERVDDDQYDILINNEYIHTVAYLERGVFELSHRDIENYSKRGTYEKLGDMPIRLHEKREIGHIFKNHNWRW